MNNILLKSLALAVLGGSVPSTAVAAYNTNHQNLSIITKPKQVGFVNNNPIYNRNQQDSQGSDSVTLEPGGGGWFTFNYEFSSATLSYFYPAIGSYVSPAEQLYQLMTKGSAWFPTTHYWGPLEQVNNFNTIVGANIYKEYLPFLHNSLIQDFSWNSNLQPSSAMAILQKAMDTGSGYRLGVSVRVASGSVQSTFLTGSLIANNYPPTAKTQGADAVFGNMNEPDNLFKLLLSTKSCQYIYEHYRNNIPGFISWLFKEYPARADLSEYVNTNHTSQGFRYVAYQIEDFWTTPNYSRFTASILANFKKIMQAVNNPANTHGITLLFARDVSGYVHMSVTSQLQAFRPVYYNVRKILEGRDFSTYAFLTVQDMIALRSASFRYLGPEAAYTTKARDYAIDWLFNTHNPQWANADVVHSWILGSQLVFPDAWTHGITNWNWKDVDQFMAEAIIQNRGIVLYVNHWYHPNLSTVSYYEQNAVPQKA